ncbi:serine/threonine-protein kinase [Solwaraspora sp. WMMA2056]|uniref:serine/threonine-protein kinase n=1 Tax=Solwaraspora sp. WMMA2056 TaxID=3015161 RepID=UPI00259B0376|nr:serine/threonine-protein kinase [Solwaraspora sp. WMMA2056]WJK42191.1 serine/threonine-protein kinase [Solwaraspora sp. WMMA2056]
MANDRGQLLGDRYRLIERLGAGGTSVVWRGYDEILDRQVAVKVLAPQYAPDQAFRTRIRVEAQAAARLCHPHITNVYDYGEARRDDATLPYVVMELVDGESLADRLRRDHVLPWRVAVAVCAEVASALAAAHATGVVHRDVTPANVMLTSTGAKVVDFGISALTGESDVGPDGNLLGTPAYLAPERLNGGQVSPATDVYAVGLLLYRSLTGRLPWPAANVTEMLRAHLHTAPDPMPPVAGLPAEVIGLTVRCLAKRPADRPTSEEVAKTLAAAVGVAAGRSSSTMALPVQAPGVDAADADAGPGAGPDAGTDGLPPLVDVTCGLEVTGLDLSATDAYLSTTGADPARTDGDLVVTGAVGRAASGPVALSASGPVAAAGPAPAPAPGSAAATGPAGGAGRRRRLRTSWVQRRAEAVVIGIGLMMVSALVWAGAGATPATDRAREALAAPPRLGLAAQTPTLAAQSPAPCQVDYAVHADDGRRFVAVATVTNTGSAALTDWSVRFAFPGTQRLTAVASAQWHQQGPDVVLRPVSDGAPLAAGASTAVRLTGDYHGVNTLPLEFHLDEQHCGVTVAAIAGQSAGAPDLLHAAVDTPTD